MNKLAVKTAIKCSSKGDHRTKIGACITKSNKILATGHNEIRTHERFRRLYNSQHHKDGLHAEVSVIFNFLKNNGFKYDLLQDCDLYVVRIMHNKSLGLSKPCPNCMKIIEMFKFRRIYYSTDFGTIEYIKGR